MYYQDLPQEFQNKIFEGLRTQLEIKGQYAHERLDDYINCNNTEENVKEWVNDFCL